MELRLGQPPVLVHLFFLATRIYQDPDLLMPPKAYPLVMTNIAIENDHL
jgi:hypothetical protein